MSKDVIISPPNQQTRLHLADVVAGMYVSFQYDGDIYPGEVTHVTDADNIKICAMEKAGPNHWKWPQKKDEIFYKLSELHKTLPCPIIQTSRGHFSFSIPL